MNHTPVNQQNWLDPLTKPQRPEWPDRTGLPKAQQTQTIRSANVQIPAPYEHAQGKARAPVASTKEKYKRQAAPLHSPALVPRHPIGRPSSKPEAANRSRGVAIRASGRKRGCKSVAIALATPRKPRKRTPPTHTWVETEVIPKSSRTRSDRRNRKKKDP